MADTIVVRSTERVVVPQLARAPVEVESRGPQGRPGVGIELRGTYPDEASLIAAHPAGVVGETYAVAGDLYVWSADDGAWINAGPFQGPPGAPGQIRYTGHGAPGVIVGAEPGDTYADLDSGTVYKLT